MDPASTSNLSVTGFSSEVGSSSDRNCDEYRVQPAPPMAIAVDAGSSEMDGSEDRNCDECRVRSTVLTAIVDGPSEDRNCNECQVRAAPMMITTIEDGPSEAAWSSDNRSYDNGKCSRVRDAPTTKVVDGSRPVDQENVRGVNNSSERVLPVVRVIQTGSMIIKKSHIILRQNYSRKEYQEEPHRIRWEEAVPVIKGADRILLKLPRSASYNSSGNCKRDDHDAFPATDDYGFDLPSCRGSVSFPPSPSHMSLFDSTQGGASPSSSLSSSSTITTASLPNVKAKGGIVPSSIQSAPESEMAAFMQEKMAMAPASDKAKMAMAPYATVKTKTGTVPSLIFKVARTRAMPPSAIFKATRTRAMAPSMKPKTAMAGPSSKAKTAMATPSSNAKTGMGSKRRFNPLLLCFFMQRRGHYYPVKKTTTIGGVLSATWRALKKSLVLYRCLHRRQERREGA